MGDYSLKVGGPNAKRAVKKMLFRSLSIRDMFAWDVEGIDLKDSSEWRMKLKEDEYIQLTRSEPINFRSGAVKFNETSTVIPLEDIYIWKVE